MSVIRVEVIIADDPEVLSRIARVVSTAPFQLVALDFSGLDTDRRRRRILIHVETAGLGEELLTKRLNRLVSTHKVRVLDRL